MKINIGIDGGKKTGFAVWSPKQKKFIEIQTLNFWEAIKNLSEYKKKYNKDLTVFIEDVSANKKVFKAFFVFKSTNGNLNQKIGAVTRVARNVGHVEKETELIIDFCKLNDINIIKARPTEKSNTKMKAYKFKILTGYDKRTNEHSRDAAMLVFETK